MLTGLHRFDGFNRFGGFGSRGHRFFDFGFEFLHQFRVVLYEGAHSIAALTQFRIAVAEPGAGLVDDVHLDAEVNDLA